MENVNLNAIEEAAQRVKGHIHVTPVMTCGMLNNMAPGRNLFFKCELLQKTGSFKIRGALNAVTKLVEGLPEGHEKPKVVTHSSGNFGQALAYAAQLRDLGAYVVMPETAPKCKVNAVKGYGAEVITCKPTEESRRTTGEEVQRRTGAHFFSPSQTYDVIAGQGTIGLELLDQIPDLDAVIVPVGGGGMISGIATALKSKNPAIKVYAAEPENADDCFQSFQAKKLIPLPPGPVHTVADGLRVSIGESTWPIIEKHVDDVITVTENEIKDATRHIWQLMKLFIEPSAGVGIAAALSQKFSLKSQDLKNVAVILCGGNVDIDSVKHWL
ncbi:serine racemase [Strongylocentrotus purpuratus]|uniref:L-serine ammonia-lyase n=1 Tax=Strongylocentrotus purpuratus TaxID=7668 RepID=A0A7M7GIB8_STRPU|nr:serine racemase [Strongylocentrotus purpuratus]